MRYRAIAVFSAMLLVISGVSAQVPQESYVKVSLAHTAVEFSEHTSLTNAFAKVLYGTGVSGGIATVENICGTKFYDFHIPNGMRLSDALDALMAKDERYTWKPMKGTAIVLPKNGMPNLLKTRIKYVRVSDRNNLTLALNELLRTKEVAMAIVNLKAIARSPEVGFQKLNKAETPSEKTPIDFTNISLVDALNSLASEHTHAVWSYDENGCDGQKSVKLDFISK